MLPTKRSLNFLHTLMVDNIYDLRQKARELLETNNISPTGRFICEHMTLAYNPRRTCPDYIPLERNTPCEIIIDALVVDNRTGASAFRVVDSKIINNEENKNDDTEIVVVSNKPHITATLGYNTKPVYSLNFVFKTDDTVTIIPVELVISATAD